MPGPPRELLKLPGNRCCADCGAPEPRWASVNLGILVCEVCSGIHRRLGTHVSQVRSATLDDWKPEWVETLRRVGNARSKAFYEHDVPESERLDGAAAAEAALVGGDRLDAAAARALERWIRAKYEARRYTPTGPNALPPPEEQEEASVGGAAAAGGGGSGAGGVGDEADAGEDAPLVSWAAWPRQEPSAEAASGWPSAASPSAAAPRAPLPPTWPVLTEDADYYIVEAADWPSSPLPPLTASSSSAPAAAATTRRWAAALEGGSDNGAGAWEEARPEPKAQVLQPTPPAEAAPPAPGQDGAPFLRRAAAPVVGAPLLNGVGKTQVHCAGCLPCPSGLPVPATGYVHLREER